MKDVKVTYYAMLRETAGKTEEFITTNANTIKDFYEELRQKYNFPLQLTHLAAAVNDTFVKLDTEIKTGDNVVFIPPVAGG